MYRAGGVQPQCPRGLATSRSWRASQGGGAPPPPVDVGTLVVPSHEVWPHPCQVGHGELQTSADPLPYSTDRPVSFDADRLWPPARRASSAAMV